jgi:hypothetical protein
MKVPGCGNPVCGEEAPMSKRMLWITLLRAPWDQLPTAVLEVM